MDVHFTEQAVREGGLGERVTLPAFAACMLLHSGGVAARLLERPPIDHYADRLVRDPSTMMSFTHCLLCCRNKSIGRTIKLLLFHTSFTFNVVVCGLEIICPKGFVC